jgi:Arc/MetJ-type ribon-helix-helix transcriptional regulator
MKSALIPQVRVEPQLRSDLEAVLKEGESLSEFVETSVRSAVEYRREQTLFHARGQVASENYQRSGISVSAEEVLAKLQAKVNAKRKQLSR